MILPKTAYPLSVAEGPVSYGAAPKPRSGGLIKDHYIAEIEEIAQEVRLGPKLSRACEIPRDATRERCVEYAMEYVVSDRSHYRYRRYSEALRRMWDASVFQQPTIVHLDIGCGAGLFSWVVHDELCEKRGCTVDFFALDRASEMCRLAEDLWNGMSAKIKLPPLTVECDAALLTQRVMEVNAPFDFLVTFGYVLVQNADNPATLSGFAQVVTNLCHDVEGTSVIVAHDSLQSVPFTKACRVLLQELRKRGCNFIPRFVPEENDAWEMCATLNPW